MRRRRSQAFLITNRTADLAARLAALEARSAATDPAVIDLHATAHRRQPLA